MIAAVIAVLAVTAYFVIGWRVRSLAEVSLEQAEQFLKERDNARARQSLEWLLWFAPSNDRALLIAGISLNADRRFAEAVALLQRIPESSPQYKESGFALAASLHMDGQWERAERVLVGYLERFPDSREARERLLKLYLAECRLRDARGHLERRWSEN